MREATLPVNHCQCFLPSPRGFLLPVPFVQVQNVPGQMFKGMLLSFTSDHHLHIPVLQGSTGGDEHSDGTGTLMVLPEREGLTLLSLLCSSLPVSSPSFFAYILRLHSSICQSTCGFVIFPFLLFGTLHLT